MVIGWSDAFKMDRSASYANVNYYYESVYQYWRTRPVYPTPEGDNPGNDMSHAEFRIPMRQAIDGLWSRALDGNGMVRVWAFGP